MTYNFYLQPRGYGKSIYEKQLNEVKIMRKKGIVIVIDGKPVPDPEKKCVECNYCECETCPTRHGWKRRKKEEDDD